MPVVNERLADDPEKSKRGRSTGAKIAMGCGIAAAVFVLLLIVAIIVVAFNVKRIGRFVLAKGTDAIIESSTLADAEKDDAKATVRRFVEQAMDGKIPQSKAEAIIRELMQGSLGQMVVIGAAHQAVQKSGLSEAEKKRGIENLQRFMAGFAQKRFSDAEISSVLDAAPRQPAGGPKQPPWSDDEVRTVLAQVERALEGKDIQPTDTMPIPAEDLRKAIRAMKEALGEPVPPPAEDSTE